MTIVGKQRVVEVLLQRCQAWADILWVLLRGVKDKPDKALWVVESPHDHRALR